jgi:3-hydroxybutyryl-CoA dehydrogenase
MKILVVGDELSQAEFKAKFKEYPDSIYKNCQNLKTDDLKDADIVFDFYTHQGDHFKIYHENPGVMIFSNSVLTTLLSVASNYNLKNPLVGFNGLPSMFNRPVLELTTTTVPPQQLAEVCKQLDTPYECVADRVGMATPRVVCMIINEAYYTAQEGTAAPNDIDLGMKLGTRYPAGPFEMCSALGIQAVYQVLEALYEDTRDERYKICPALKTAYLQAG